MTCVHRHWRNGCSTTTDYQFRDEWCRKPRVILLTRCAINSRRSARCRPGWLSTIAFSEPSNSTSRSYRMGCRCSARTRPWRCRRMRRISSAEKRGVCRRSRKMEEEARGTLWLVRLVPAPNSKPAAQFYVASCCGCLRGLPDPRALPWNAQCGITLAYPCAGADDARLYR